MKKISVPRLALTYAGCFLGAGYVSGQELWQFFGTFGLWGLVGLVFALGFMMSFSVLLIRLVQRTGIVEMDRIVVPWEMPWLRNICAVLEVVGLFGVAVIMVAGAGALLSKLFPVPVWLGCAVFALVVMLVSAKGLSGMVMSFSLTVPVLVGATVLFAAVAAIKNGGNFVFHTSNASENPLLGSWILSALSFVGYNLFGSIGILSPIGSYVEKRGTAEKGVSLGSVFLLLIALSVLFAMLLMPETVGEELPMLSAALELFPLGGYCYGALLLFAMFGTALSTLVAVFTYFELHFPKAKKYRSPIAAVGGIALFAGSLVGFGDLIGVIYPLFGYAGSVFLVLVLIHSLQRKRSDENGK